MTIPLGAASAPCLTVPDREHRWSEARQRFELVIRAGVSAQQCGCAIVDGELVGLDRQPTVLEITVERTMQALTVEFVERAGPVVHGSVTARYRPAVPAGSVLLNEPRPAAWLLEPAVDQHTRERLRRGAAVDRLLIAIPDPVDLGGPPPTVQEAAGRILEALARHREQVADADSALADVLDAVRRATGDVPIAPDDTRPRPADPELCADCEHRLDDHDEDGCCLVDGCAC